MKTTNGNHSPQGVSSPLIEIPAPEPEDEDDAVTEIHVDGIEDDLIATMMAAFPYAEEGDHTGAANTIMNHLDKGRHEPVNHVPMKLMASRI